MVVLGGRVCSMGMGVQVVVWCAEGGVGSVNVQYWQKAQAGEERVPSGMLAGMQGRGARRHSRIRPSTWQVAGDALAGAVWAYPCAGMRISGPAQGA